MENELTALSALCTNAAKAVSDLNKSKREYNFVDNKSLDIDQRIENAEGHFDRLDEVFDRKKNITTSLNTIVTDLDKTSNKIKSEMASYSIQNDNDKLYEIFNIRIALYEEKCKMDIKPIEDEINRIKQAKNNKIDQIMKSEKFINLKKQHDEEEEERIKREHITLEEKANLENLMGYRIESVVFNSDIDNWSQTTSVFINKIMNKSNLCFLVEDTNHNKFGGVFTGNINAVDNWISSGSSYIFSLVRGGTLNPKKFGKSGNDNYEFYLYSQDSQYLFIFGNGRDIKVYKKGVNGSHCNPSTYTAKHNELTDNEKFTPKSVVVFQLN
uniref:TLDc domain-containing protein n=1 Tax=Entamoeba invadens TaxID=33085 RepID=S0B3V5_ENTIV|nr:hypothetical protein [Entamoeba invadens]BAN40517.1 hypothetical protein [Entamoeba invadens]